MAGDTSINLDIISKAYEELAEAEANKEIDVHQCSSFPHIRLSPERARYYFERMNTLIDDILQETPDPDGKVYGILTSMFLAPNYMQGPGISMPSESVVADEEKD